MNEAVVVMPVYKDELTPNETLSFQQGLRVLGSHPMALICPEGLRLDAYEPEKHGLRVHRFAAHYFESTRTYNKLMLSPRFYASFLRFRYMLIYQLDAFVFSDQLLEWCRLGYDYVGAPWIDSDWLPVMPMWRPPWSRDNLVGNGGFSLRRIRSSLAAVTLFRPWARRWPMNEDGFFAFFAASYYPRYRIPSTEVALRFSFEDHPARCYQRAGRRLPFGCHAWEKTDPVFWSDFIPPRGA
jgi:hypothetical protein